MQEPLVTLNYHNITISGIAGTGTTTLLRSLTQILEPIGWSGYSGGEYMRRFLPETVKTRDGHHTAEDYDESVDRMTDYSIRQQLETGSGLIIESWLSGFMAQGVPDVLKVLLVCTNELDRAKRLASRDGMGESQAMLSAFERLRANTNRWSRMYEAEWDEWIVRRGILHEEAPHFFWHPNLYDLVIDTGIYNPEAVTDKVLDRMGYTESVRK